MQYYITFLLLKLAYSFPNYYYPQLSQFNYQRNSYHQRYNIPSSYYNNYYYQQPCYRCDNQKNGVYLTSQQQFVNYNNDNSNINKYTSPYQRPNFGNGNNGEYTNTQTNIPYQSTYMNSPNKNIYIDFNSETTITPILNTDSSTSIPFTDQGTISFAKDHQDFVVSDNGKSIDNHQLGIQISNPSLENDNFNKFEMSPTISRTESPQQIPISTSITENSPLESNITNTSQMTLPNNNENEETKELSSPIIKENSDISSNDESKINEEQRPILVNKKKDVDYVLYQEVTSLKNSSKNGDSDFYDTTIVTN
uniref:GATA zinc finger domain-containing protein 14-like n=1 Tax=Strongyloides venezuelensis TaxID=75913 RepID=A0A0K0F3Z5_STRVS